jgi:hypothetical protein
MHVVQKQLLAGNISAGNLELDLPRQNFLSCEFAEVKQPNLISI